MRYTFVTNAFVASGVQLIKPRVRPQGRNPRIGSKHGTLPEREQQ